jgi:predicted metal-dependent phosphoesterase TrpH
MFADLHIHSTFSDGTDTPLELCSLAIEHNIKVISITDHDAIGGQKSLVNLQKPEGVEVIPGIELTAYVKGKIPHILGYYVDLFDNQLERIIDDISKKRTESTRINFENACAKNVFSFEWKRVLELNREQARITALHVIKAMRIDGYQIPGMSFRDFFNTYFRIENKNYISKETLTGYDAIDAIKSAGGIPIIAHPKSIQDDDIVLDLIRYGAQGIEVYHSSHTREEEKKYLHMAEQEKIYITGGTDWHGKNNRPEITHFGMNGLTHGNYEILNQLTLHRKTNQVGQISGA